MSVPVGPSLKVSVLINNYNYGRFLGECVESALAQTYGNIEVIAYDDGSSDHSLSILKKYEGNIQIIAASRCGDTPCFNQANAIWRAFAVASGEWIALLDSDDTFRSDKIEQIVQAVHAHPDAVLVQHPFWEIDESSRPTGHKRPYIKNVDIEKYVYTTHNLTGLFSQTSGLTFRRDYLERMLPIAHDSFDTVWPDVRLTRPSFFWGEVVTLLEPLGFYRVHGQNDSSKLLDRSYKATNIQQIYECFNEVAEKYGKPTVDINRSILRPGQTTVEKSFALVFGQEPLSIKWHYVGNEIRRRIAAKRGAS